MRKRFFAILLALLMFVCLLSTTAFAAEPTVTAIEDLVYNGQAQELVSADVPEGYTMYYAKSTKETDRPTSTKASLWKPDVPTAVDAGTYYVWYYAKDGDKATEISEGIKVTIDPLELPDGALEVARINTPTYTGTELKPTPSFSTMQLDGKTTLYVRAKDYSTKYANNVNAGENTASVTIEAKAGGNYIFKAVTVPFSISKATVYVSQDGLNHIELAEDTRVYDPDDYTAKVEITTSDGCLTFAGKASDTLVVKSVSGSLTNNEVGTQRVALNADNVKCQNNPDSDNYNVRINKTLSIEIIKADITDNDYTAPTAKENLTPGVSQLLVEAGSAPNGATMWYHLVDGEYGWSTDIGGITGKTPGKYAVEYYIEGGRNYNDLGSEEEPLGPVEVTIEGGLGSMLSGGSIAIIVAVAVIAAGAVTAIVITKKKRSAN